MPDIRVESISVYPVKSFGPVLVPVSRIVDGGGLEHDREFALFDSEGKYVNGKRNPKVHQLIVNIDWKDAALFLKVLGSESEPLVFDLRNGESELEKWLSEFFGFAITWQHNSRGGFPDDTKAPGPTLISNATYREVTSWYPGLEVTEIRKRFRANIEFACDEAFWEDCLFAEPNQIVRFKIGDVEMHGTNPCKRCVVPTRQTLGGDSYPEFGNIFMANRQSKLPSWSTRSRFDHFYRLAINTRVPDTEVGKQVRVGDKVEIIGVQTA